ncbi:retrovirus-related pol polyprotein from transposon TNT 1-94, partial [Tanacetum coccineum]
MKNKTVEVHHRNVKSSLNKTNRVSVCNINVKHGVLNANIEHVCSTCNECLFDANNDICVVVYLNDVNAHARDKSKSFNKYEWKPTDNGTKFVNQTLKSYYEDVGITHQTSVVRTPQQNINVERRNRTLVEAARTMLIFSKALLFLWAEAVATTCYTQNQSLICTRHNKTLYEMMHDCKPYLKYLYVFGALCYPTNNSEDLGKLKPKADIGIYIGYSPAKKAYRIYKKWTRLIMETIHVDFDELTTLASEQFISSTPYVPPSIKDMDILFQPLFDEYFKPSPSVVSPQPLAAVLIPDDTTGKPSSTIIDQDAPSYFLMLFGVTAALIGVNDAQSKLVPLENFNENYSKCLRFLYKVNAAEGVNAAIEEVSTAELQKLVSQLEILDKKLSQEDVNQKLLRSLSPEWNTHAVVWRNKAELETMSMDDLYNNLKVYELEVKGMSSLILNTQNMAFVSSLNNNTNEAVNTAHGVSTASTQVNAAYSTNIDNLSDAVICSFFASQPNSPELAHEDLQQIHPDDIEKMDLRWQMAMLTMRARRFLKNTGRKHTVNGNKTIGFNKS